MRTWTRPVTVERAFEFFLLLTIASGHLALIATREITILHFALLLSSLAAMIFWDKKLARLPAWLWNTITIAVLLISLATALKPPRGFESFFYGATYLIAGVLAVRYFTRSTPRDYFWLLILCLFEICAASIATISISFLATLVLFAFAMINSLLLLTVRNEAQSSQPTDASPPPAPRVQRRFFWFAGTCTAVIFALGFAVFFVIPRVGRSLFAWSRGIHPRVSGFSESIQLGALGRFKQSQSLVMRVKLSDSDRLPGAFYLRGAALDNYNGKQWRDSLGVGRHGYHYLDREGNASVGEIARLADTVKQEIILEPTNSNIIFGLPFIKAVNVPTRQRAVVVTRNEYVRLPLDYPLYDRLAYTLWSVPPPEAAAQCADGDTDAGLVPSEVYYNYLQLPADQGRVRDLARRAAGDDPSPCRQALNISEYLQKNYTYDLNTPSDQAADPLADFLFNSRRGYCEHFATALCVMLRCQGIPARVAVGYLAEDYNPQAEYFQVRESDAHSWVEMRLPDGQWVTLDSTPSEGRPRHASTALTWLIDIFDAVKFRWDRYVVDLSLQQQYQIAGTIRNRGMIAGRGLTEIPGIIGRLLTGLTRGPVALLLLPAAALVYYIIARRRERAAEAGPGRVRDARLAGEYSKLLRRVQARGFERRPSETALELAERVSDAGLAGAAAFAEATTAYLKARFGDPRLAGAARAAIRRAFLALAGR